jgi:hypothetical protein
MANATIRTTADAITTALWGVPASRCPSDGAVLAFPGRNGRKAWPGETDERIVWCHDCTADGFGFVPASMLTGHESVEVTFDGNRATLRGCDLFTRCVGEVLTGREACALREALPA